MPDGAWPMILQSYLILLISWLPWLLPAVVALYLGRRAIRAFERRGADQSESVALRQQVQALEATVAEQAEELRRLAESQRFTERLLLEGAPAVKRVPADSGAA